MVEKCKKQKIRVWQSIFKILFGSGEAEIKTTEQQSTLH